MKTKQEIYDNTRQMVNDQDQANYLEYYKVFLDTQERRDLPNDEIEQIRAAAFAEYKKKEAELYDILDMAYIDLMADDPFNKAI